MKLRTLALALAAGAQLPLFGCNPVLMTVGPGGSHTCATTNDRVGKCWGGDDEGQLGDGSAGLSRSTPAVVSGLGVATSVVSGFNHACAILESQELYCWGSNEFGQLGSGSSAARSATPVRVGWPPPIPPVIPPSQTTLLNVISVAASDGHTCAAIENGEVWCWGLDSSGELGSPQIRGNSSTPQLVTDLHIPNVGGPAKTKQVAAAGQFTCALLEDATVWCWGLNNRGQMGRGTTSDSETPAPVSGLTQVASIAVGHDQACAVVNGAALCWGENLSGFSSTTPTTIPGLSSVRAVAAGSMHACALSLDGTVKCWGSNYFGQLGVSSPSSSPTPVAVPGLTKGVKIGAGHFSTCVVDSDAALWCWGLNSEGQLGVSSPEVVEAPMQVVGL